MVEFELSTSMQEIYIFANVEYLFVLFEEVMVEVFNFKNVEPCCKFGNGFLEIISFKQNFSLFFEFLSLDNSSCISAW